MCVPSLAIWTASRRTKTRSRSKLQEPCRVRTRLGVGVGACTEYEGLRSCTNFRRVEETTLPPICGWRGLVGTYHGDPALFVPREVTRRSLGRCQRAI
jgi:hypothetical protein